MTYLRIKNFWDYQNADAWKKAAASKKQEPPGWCKLYRRRDRDLDRLPIPARLLFHELLKVATEHLNAIPNETEWIASEVKMPVREVEKALSLLLQGAWLKETRTGRPSREFLEKFSPKEVRSKKKKEEEEQAGEPTALKSRCPDCDLGGGNHTTDCLRRIRLVEEVA